MHHVPAIIQQTCCGMAEGLIIRMTLVTWIGITQAAIACLLADHGQAPGPAVAVHVIR
jgi:hypothetical protein